MFVIFSFIYANVSVLGTRHLWRVPSNALLAVSFIHLAFGSDTVQSLILKIEHRAEGGIHDEK